ncbi:hypothetical protein CR513_45315, partial [Mucuna pruriens]
MEDKAFGKGPTLILGQPFFMTVKTKINAYAGTLLMEFGDNLVQFNIFEALKHPAENHSIFNIDTIDELVEEHMRMGMGSAKLSNFVEISNIINCFYTVEAISNSDSLSYIQNFSHFEDDFADLADVVKVQRSPEMKRVESDFKDKKEVETDSDDLEEVETNSNRQSKARFNSSQHKSKQAEAESNSGQLSPH